METSNTRFKHSFLKGSLLVFVASSLLVTPTISEAKSEKHDKTHFANMEVTKYPSEIVKGISLTLRQEKHGKLTPSEITELIDNMSKVNAMDSYLKTYSQKLTGSKVREIVQQIYKIDLDAISDLGAGTKQSTYPAMITNNIEQLLNVEEVDTYISTLSKSDIMDLYVEARQYDITPSELRIVINLIFGTNLDGIPSLEHSGIGLFSKGQWINQSNEDLFIIHTSDDDVDVRIYPTDYFKERTGLHELPTSLQDSLQQMGYTFNEDVGAYYYADPNGQSVADSFKGQTLGVLIKYIGDNYSDL
ncbi:hypothetical protein ACNRWW_19365 [Metabacillus sp. HB246100]